MLTTQAWNLAKPAGENITIIVLSNLTGTQVIGNATSTYLLKNIKIIGSATLNRPSVNLAVRRVRDAKSNLQPDLKNLEVSVTFPMYIPYAHRV